MEQTAAAMTERRRTAASVAMTVHKTVAVTLVRVVTDRLELSVQLMPDAQRLSTVTR